MKNEVCDDVFPTNSQFYGNDSNTLCDGCKETKIAAQRWERKYKDLKKRYVKLSVHFCELHMKYNDLKTTTNSVNSHLVDASTNSVHSDIADDEVLSTDAVFTLDEITFLRSIPLAKAKDSSFILQCLQYAYKSNPSVLLYKSLKGVAESTEIKDDGTHEYHPAKEPLTPKKVVRIQKLFIERLDKCKTGSVDYGERIKQANINKLFASGINNIIKKHKHS